MFNVGEIMLEFWLFSQIFSKMQEYFAVDIWKFGNLELGLPQIWNASPAFAEGGCDKIQRIDCEATNKVALTAYRSEAAKSSEIAGALECLEKKCAVQHTATHGLRVDLHQWSGLRGGRGSFALSADHRTTSRPESQLGPRPLFFNHRGINLEGRAEHVESLTFSWCSVCFWSRTDRFSPGSHAVFQIWFRWGKHFNPWVFSYEADGLPHESPQTSCTRFSRRVFLLHLMSSTFVFLQRARFVSSSCEQYILFGRLGLSF